jgi:integrative and conjugative element protein (TIGR02256 family)
VTASSRLWRAWITEAAQAELLEAAQRAHPRETGGVLIGVLAHGRRPWITNAIELPSSKSTATSFEVPARSRRKAVERLRLRDARLGYLGEWHVHPADVPPSPTDTSTLAHLAADPEAGCDRPMLLIARRTAAGYKLDGRQLSRKTLRQLQMLASGPVPEASTAPLRPTGPRTTRRRRRRIFLRSR